MINKSPKVEIIIPVYNGSNYLEQAIYSALSQTYLNTQVTVVNDGSTDDGKTAKIAEFFGDRIKYLEKINGGVASALNFALEQSDADYISWLSHDDLYSSKKIENQMAVIVESKNPGESVYFSSYQIINADGEFISEVNITELANIGRLQLGCYPLVRSLISGCTLLIPRHLINKYGGFDESLRFTQDYNLWLKLILEHEFKYIDKTDTFVRIHQNQDSQKYSNSKLIRENEELWKDIISQVTEKNLLDPLSRLEIECILYNHLSKSIYTKTSLLVKSNLQKYLITKMKKKKYWRFTHYSIDNFNLLCLDKVNLNEIIAMVTNFYFRRQSVSRSKLSISRKHIIWDFENYVF